MSDLLWLLAQLFTPDKLDAERVKRSFVRPRGGVNFDVEKIVHELKQENSVYGQTILAATYH